MVLRYLFIVLILVGCGHPADFVGPSTVSVAPPTTSDSSPVVVAKSLPACPALRVEYGYYGPPCSDPCHQGAGYTLCEFGNWTEVPGTDCKCQD